MLEVKNLHVNVGTKEILSGINLSVKPGELHFIMGPNGSGKSTLAQVLTGRENYEVTRGEILYKGKNLLDMSIEDRAREGLFLSFQYPVEIPGVSNVYFLRTAVNTIRKHRGLDELDAVDFLSEIKQTIQKVKMDESFLRRPVNEGFSGGEKKRNEILQMIMLEPSLAILDETDSGLDIDALKIVAEGVNKFRRKDRAIILITHYQRILNYMDPDRVHVLLGGRIVLSDGKELAHELEMKGYTWLEQTDEKPAAVAAGN